MAVAKQALWEGTLGFIGAGSMAQAMVSGLVGGGFLAPRRVWAVNRQDDARLAELARWGAHTTRDKAEVCRRSELIVLAVKPKDAEQVLGELRPHLTADHVLLSLMAGIPTAYIESLLDEGARVVRAMPNTSSAVRESATAISAGRHASPEDMAVVAALLGAVGQVLIVDEEALAAVTALSGSGPAYVYLLLESLIQAGEAAGLEREVARRLVLQTVYGSAKMVRETERDPAELRQKVSSPGGTTVAALSVLEESGFRESLIRAVARAKERSVELGQAWAVGDRV